VISLFDFSGASGPLGIASATAAFIFGALFFLPRPVMCVAAGVVLGATAIPIALFGSTIGAALAFLIARYCFRETVLGWVSKRPLWGAVIRALEEEGWRVIFLLRLASPLPGSLTSYLFGVSGVRLLPYCVATLVGLAPQIVLFVEVGAFGYEATWGSHLNLNLLMTGAGIVATASVVWLVTNRARRLLEKQICTAAVVD
jgi:uncharacterized membrane protein YdjX (TVP38/TMEM64 family)